jgi:hypothetical protein
MSTEVFWNDAKPPRDADEHRAAEWLVLIARNAGITTVTADNVGEWLWRYAFVQEMLGRSHRDYKTELSVFADVLARFRSATLAGRVGDDDREEFVAMYVANRVACCREQADGVEADVQATA